MSPPCLFWCIWRGHNDQIFDEEKLPDQIFYVPSKPSPSPKRSCMDVCVSVCVSMSVCVCVCVYLCLCVDGWMGDGWMYVYMYVCMLGMDGWMDGCMNLYVYVSMKSPYVFMYGISSRASHWTTQKRK